jgi:predicted RND superfamily exporter protein
MVIAPTVVGTSIDNSVHLYHRYKEMGKKNLMLALRSTGGAAFLSSATNICGFLGLAFVSHSGLRSIGNLAILGMTACLITTLLFFPALLQFLEDRRKN